MKIKPFITLGVLAGALYSNSLFSNPASVDYVKNALNGLRAELSASLNTLQSTTHLEMENIESRLNVGVKNVENSLNVRVKNVENNLNVGMKNVENSLNELPIIKHHIGEVFQGGIIFYVDASQQHGLMASLNDLTPETIEWRNGEAGERRVNAQGQGLGAGEANTWLIIAEQTIDSQEGEFAALLAAKYQVADDGLSDCSENMSTASPCYSGWYLPSVYELMLLHENLKNQGTTLLADAPYWSSTEASITQAWLVDFSNAKAEISDKATLARVRAIRSF